VSSVCGKCGAKIPADAPRGSCPACLVETALDLLLQEPVVPQERDDPGLDAGVPVPDTKKTSRSARMVIDFGDYELLEEIGRGGQGVVYRARQKSLNRTVALKVIGLGQWATQAHLKRFRREAESAANLDHPCIVPIYDVGEREGSCYFSMKFIDGGQLDEVARRTPISPRNAAELIAKLARTVHYAHEHGILHRDIKPGNILLDAEGEPHLTDFGLARLLETKSTVTNTMDVLGTPSYMAPEQASGHNPATAGLTSATDVYGLGAVFYQLLTGHPPFAGGTTYETVRLVLEQEPRQPRLWNSKIDRELSTICLKCLEKDPKRRYLSALALAEDLEHWLKHEPIRAKRSGFYTHARKWVRRNPTAIATGAACLLVGVAMMWLFRGELAKIVPSPPEKSIAVLPFENLSRDPDNAYFVNGIQEEILTRLASIAELKVISRTSTQQYQSKPRNLREIANQLGVANILEGSVQKTADQVRVNVQLVNAQTDSHLWAQTYDRKLTDIFAIESEIAKRIAESLQAKLSSREQRALAVKPTNNPAAYDAYLRGRAFADASSWIASNVEGSIQSYQHAVALDPGFALAWAHLSYEQMWSYWQGFDASPARLAAAKEATDRAVALDPDLPDVHLTLGFYRYFAKRDLSGALAEFRAAREGAPNDADMIQAVAFVQRRLGHFDEAIAELHRAIELNPRHVYVYQNLAETYSCVRRFSEALAAAETAGILQPADATSLRLKASLLWRLTGDVQAVEPLLANSTAIPEIRGTQFLFQRDYAAAIGVLSNSLPVTTTDQRMGGYLPERQQLQLLLGLSQHRAGDVSAARGTYQQALKDIQRALGSAGSGSNLEATLHSALGEAYAGLGEADAAIDEGRKATATIPASKDPYEGPVYEEKMARIFAQLGDVDRAIDLLKRLLQTPYDFAITPGLLRLDPIWDPLRADPRFQELCKDKQP
jgi:serine/threonine protein kinase/Flp pilus assembly protein TadD